MNKLRRDRVRRAAAVVVTAGLAGDRVPEERCQLCSGMWPSEREGFRACLYVLPASAGVCDACLMAFWHNIADVD